MAFLFGFPGLPRSKLFWSSSSMLGLGGFAYFYDRYRCRVINNQITAFAMALGQEPLSISEDPKMFSILVVGNNQQVVSEKKALFKKHAAKWITMAGIDFKFIVINLEEIEKNTQVEVDATELESNALKYLIQAKLTDLNHMNTLPIKNSGIYEKYFSNSDLKDLIITLDEESYQAIKDLSVNYHLVSSEKKLQTGEWPKTEPFIPKVPLTIALIDCKPIEGVMNRLYGFFTRRILFEKWTIQTGNILENRTERINDYLIIFKNKFTF